MRNTNKRHLHPSKRLATICYVRKKFMTDTKKGILEKMKFEIGACMEAICHLYYEIKMRTSPYISTTTKNRCICFIL